MFLCAEFLNQCQSDGIFDNVGICKEQLQYACLHHFSLVCEYHAGKIALTPQTKCVETIVIFFVAAFIILTNKEMFFEREHIGYLLSYHEEREVDD